MIRINLLPHREEARKARRQQFYALSGVMLVFAGVIWFIGFTVLSGYITAQEDKNAFLKREIAILNKDIEEIKKLKEQTDSLLARKQIIESLQANRTEIVHLFNELARLVPAGIYLKSIKQTGNKIQLIGYTQSNARVSTLMYNLDQSPLLERPQLVEIKAVMVDKRRMGEFNLDVYLTRQQTDSPNAQNQVAKAASAAQKK